MGAVLSLFVLVGCQSAADHATPTAAGADSSSAPSSNPSAQPYADLRDRAIRALSPEQVDDLLAGRGAGYALAAELNHYPGPAHVLELADALGLGAEQRRRVEAVRARMQQEAAQLGQRLVEVERELDAEFRAGAIDARVIDELTATSAEVEGRLRAVHLRAHLETAGLLSEEQIALYDELRGYASAGEQDHAAPGGRHRRHAP